MGQLLELCVAPRIPFVVQIPPEGAEAFTRGLPASAADRNRKKDTARRKRDLRSASVLRLIHAIDCELHIVN